MKIYCVISRMPRNHYLEFKEILKWLINWISIEFYLSDIYYEKILKEKKINIRSWCIYHELVLLKYMKEEKGISYNEISWIYNEEMVILNESLYIFKDNKWTILNNEKIHIMAVKLASNNPFRFLLEKIPNIRVSFANKRKKYHLKWDKLEHIIDIYKKRNEYIWDFMLPLYKNRSLEWIKRILLLRKEVLGKNFLVLKWSYSSDNWKDIKIIEIDKIVEREDLLEYIYIKFISKVIWNRGSIYIIDWYECKKEYRFYVNQNFKTSKVDIFYLKHKINLTTKEDLLNKKNIRTWVALHTRWENWDKKNISDNFKKVIKYIILNINENAWAIEFIEENNWNIRFLEINDLWDSIIKDHNTEKLWRKWIYWILENFDIKKQTKQ